MESNTRIIKEANIPIADISLGSDGIVYVLLKKDKTLDVDAQLQMLKVYNELTEGKLTPFLFEAEERFIVTKEARENAVQLEEKSPCKAMAVVVENLAYTMIANFYMKFHKPKRPYKVFNNRRDALKWLKGFL